MYRNICLLIISTSIFIGCGNVSDNVKNNIGEDVQAVMASLKDSVATGKVKFGISYNAAIHKSADSNAKQRIDTLQQSIITTSNFIDTLIYDVDKLENDDVNNVQVVKTIFISDGKGVSLYNSLNTSYQIALDHAINTTTKSEINKSRDNLFGGQDANKFSTMMFSANSPLGVKMFLYGAEIELLHVGQNSLEY
jgi:hypothetical protein